MFTLDDIKAVQAVMAQIGESVESGEKVIKDGELITKLHNSTKSVPQDDGWIASELTGESTIMIQLEVTLLTVAGE